MIYAQHRLETISKSGRIALLSHQVGHKCAGVGSRFGWVTAGSLEYLAWHGYKCHASMVLLPCFAMAAAPLAALPLLRSCLDFHTHCIHYPVTLRPTSPSCLYTSSKPVSERANNWIIYSSVSQSFGITHISRSGDHLLHLSYVYVLITDSQRSCTPLQTPPETLRS